jgi:3-hydroxyisobutyrate dehydrogenase
VAHIAFIGLGKMGRPMAANLVRAGYDVRGFDLLPMSRDDAAKEGVSIATSAKETP